MIFNDRIQAARLLLEKLRNYDRQRVVVLAIPRGAVPMAECIAKGLGGRIGLAPVRKVSSPLAPEFALGAADIEGNFYPERSVLQFPQEQLKTWFKKSLEVLRYRNFRWRQFLAHDDLKDRIVIVVDDGIATGATMRAALMWLRRKEPRKIVVAVPVSSQEGSELINNLADEVVCLEVSPDFAAVGEFYLHFEGVTEEDVCSILRNQFQEKEQAETQR
ncbi:MAG: phosphoribosyltransferase [Betaproteobacteria bacterium]|nr:phosphoribosyltransferase [Betaproteobacteria bacterium]